MVEVKAHGRTGRSPTGGGIGTVDVKKHSRGSRATSPEGYDVTKDSEAVSTKNNDGNIRYLFQGSKKEVDKKVDGYILDLEDRMKVSFGKGEKEKYNALKKQRDKIKSGSYIRSTVSDLVKKHFGAEYKSNKEELQEARDKRIAKMKAVLEKEKAKNKG